MALPYPSLRPLGGGAYADVHLVDENRVLKIARKTPRDGLGVTNGVFFAQGLYFGTGSVGVFHPEPNDVIAAEIAMLEPVDHPAVPRVLEKGETDRSKWFVMPHLPGKTWREAIYVDHSIGPRDLARLARTLAELAPMMPRHGDLKPDNLLVTDHGETFVLDPSAGATQLGPGGVPQHLLLTDWYNPALELSDLPALGLLIVEALTGQHLWLSAHDDLPLRKLGPRLQSWLQAREATGGARLFRRVRHLPLPTELDPRLPVAYEAVALRCLSLAWDGTQLEATEPFEDVAALATALESLEEST